MVISLIELQNSYPSNTTQYPVGKEAVRRANTAAHSTKQFSNELCCNGIVTSLEALDQRTSTLLWSLSFTGSLNDLGNTGLGLVLTHILG